MNENKLLLAESTWILLHLYIVSQQLETLLDVQFGGGVKQITAHDLVLVLSLF